MLISHDYRFIFIKTVKTAGTSVEAFLEPYCSPPGHVVTHWTPTLITRHGVIGQRWPQNDRDDLGYYNHMPASEIRQRCSQFDEYTRLTAVRDPLTGLSLIFTLVILRLLLQVACRWIKLSHF